MTATDPSTLPLHAAITQMNSGDMSASVLMEALLSRIGARDETVHAWKYINPDGARAQARAMDKMPRTGILHAIPVALKDIIETVDMPTEYGSPIYAGHRPAKDAVVVGRLRAAGAIILGKTVSTEFAALEPGPTTNPHNSDHTPGGSSSGSAAAVADFQVPVALGTQTAGSVLRPASFCGIVGYKPAFDQFPTGGIYPFAASLDTCGFFARSLRDLPILAAVLSGGTPSNQDPLAIVDPSMPPRFALFRSQHWAEADSDAKACLEKFASDLASAGGRVREQELPIDFSDLDLAHRTVMLTEAAVTHASHWHDNQNQLSEKLRSQIEAGLQFTEAELNAARETARKWRSAFQTFLEPGEIVLTLSSTGEAPIGLESTGNPIFNHLWTLLHYPALSLPVGTGKTGLPLGIQLVNADTTPDRSQAHLFAVARWTATALDLPIL